MLCVIRPGRGCFVLEEEGRVPYKFVQGYLNHVGFRLLEDDSEHFRTREFFGGGLVMDGWNFRDGDFQRHGVVVPVRFEPLTAIDAKTGRVIIGGSYAILTVDPNVTKRVGSNLCTQRGAFHVEVVNPIYFDPHRHLGVTASLGRRF